MRTTGTRQKVRKFSKIHENTVFPLDTLMCACALEISVIACSRSKTWSSYSTKFWCNCTTGVHHQRFAQSHTLLINMVGIHWNGAKTDFIGTRTSERSRSHVCWHLHKQTIDSKRTKRLGRLLPALWSSRKRSCNAFTECHLQSGTFTRGESKKMVEEQAPKAIWAKCCDKT